jgi:hypothetical protein
MANGDELVDGENRKPAVLIIGGMGTYDVSKSRSTISLHQEQLDEY